ncbi:MAG: site-specific DNA-methyltransferase [Lachnospira sp.]|nr:site-specific DNA-methyltransferase [Lachnospira sp.]
MEEKKVSQQINDIVGDNVQKLAALFPAAVRDGEVDFEALREELGQFKEVSSEKYELTWAGKKEAKKCALEDVKGRTLKYYPEESVEPETTENLYIEGDNLETLKLLRQNYYGAIRVIYIDPPYNTGEDFIYNDDFTISKSESDYEEGDASDDGERYTVNSKSSNRFHARWLSMIYTRLKICKDLMMDEGVIFISIDDNELTNLKSVCDEIFGAENYVSIISLNLKNNAGASGGGEDKRLKKNIEYILVYAKNYGSMQLFDGPYSYTEMSELIQQYLDEGKSWKYTSVLLNPGTKTYIGSTVDGDGNEIKVYSRTGVETSSVNQLAKKENLETKEVYKKYGVNVFRTTNAQTSIRTRIIDFRKKNHIEDEYLSIEYVPKTGKNKGKVYEQIYKGDDCNLFVWLRDTSEVIDGELYKKDLQGTFWDFVGETKNLTHEGEISFPNGKKPMKLVKQILSMVTDEDDIVMDFFSGSATTAHAVMALNAETGGKRKYILIQYPEKCDVGSELYKEGFETICDVGKERIKRSGSKIREESSDTVDIGFKVFKTADTNIKWNSLITNGQLDLTQIESTPDLMDFIPGSKDEDIVYELMLRQRDVPLSEKLERLPEIGERTYLYADSYLICLENKISETMVDKLAALDPVPVKFIFRDSSFGDDIALKDETFRRLKAVIDKNAGNVKVSYTVEFI